jgi:hypothetical protein
MALRVFVDDRAYDRLDRHTLAKITNALVAAERGSRALLPSLPASVDVFLETDGEVIPETGESGRVVGRREMVITLDPVHPGGVGRLIEDRLRATFFHEACHLARLNCVVLNAEPIALTFHEGLAVAFERDAADSTAPYADYSGLPVALLTHMLISGRVEDLDSWFYGSVRQGRWLGYRVGTFLVDRIMSATSLEIHELVSVRTGELLDILQSSGKDSWNS